MFLARYLIMPILCLGLLAGCALPSQEQRSQSQALDPDAAAATPLGRAIAPVAAGHAGLSGIHPLADAHDAFAARMMLARAAERSLDVQYYIWRGDMTGMMLLEALHEAADRGVRVRLLLDDNGTSGLDRELAALDGHPNIEVRLYNPFALRWPKTLGYLTDFSRLNRRMHNKSFTADNQATIIGGRNVGDEYFGAANGVLFTDLDVLAIGAAVQDVSADFDRYWASDSAYPVARLLAGRGGRAGPAQAARRRHGTLVRRRRLCRGHARPALHPSVAQGRAGTGMGAHAHGQRRSAQDPGHRAARGHAAASVARDHRQARPVAGSGVALLRARRIRHARLQRNGPRRRAGARADQLAGSHRRGGRALRLRQAPRRSAGGRGGAVRNEARAGGGRNKNLGPLGSSGSSLHAKTFAVDGQRIFVGSFNFDPRSARLNTELGFIIDSPRLASQISTAFTRDVPATAYRALLDERGKVYWLELRDDGQTVRYDSEPGASVWQRLSVWFISLLPVESLL